MTVYTEHYSKRYRNERWLVLCEEVPQIIFGDFPPEQMGQADLMVDRLIHEFFERRLAYGDQHASREPVPAPAAIPAPVRKPARRNRPKKPPTKPDQLTLF